MHVSTQQHTTRHGFTLLELLITISIIVILIGVLTAALVGARTAAQVAETESRLTSLNNATVQFKNDIGYYPPILQDDGDLSRPTNSYPNAFYRVTNQSWYSITSPAEYFLGSGDRERDGYGRVVGSSNNDPDYKEMPRFGLRHPGVDGVWNATLDEDGDEPWLNDGSLALRRPTPRGKLYGPYLEIENDQMYGRIVIQNGAPLTDPVTGQVKVFYPNDPELEGATNTSLVIVDTWGTPIRYYRPIYPAPLNQTSPYSGISKVYPLSNTVARPTLSDFFALRPYDFRPGQVMNGSLPDFMNGVSNPVGDVSTTMELQTGKFAYFSAGPDQKANNFIRADVYGLPGNSDPNTATQEVNEDNIVLVGP